MQFVADLEPNQDGGLQIMYGIDGRRDLTESTRDELSGYEGARPVRLGNGAFDQRQNDVYGAVLDSLLLHTRRSKHLPASAVAAGAVAGRMRHRRLARARPGDLGGSRRTAALRLVEADGLGRAGPRGQAGRRSATTRSWRRAGRRPRRRSAPTSSTHGVSDRGVLRQHYDTDALDASTLLAADLRFPAGQRRADEEHRRRDLRRSSPSTASCCATSPARPTTGCPARRAPS